MPKRKPRIAKFNKMKKIEETIARYQALRRQYKAEGNYAALSRLPANASPTRLVRICQLTGRSRAVYRKFHMSRNMLRELALDGKIPGVRKASW